MKKQRAKLETIGIWRPGKLSYSEMLAEMKQHMDDEGWRKVVGEPYDMQVHECEVHGTVTIIQCRAVDVLEEMVGL